MPSEIIVVFAGEARQECVRALTNAVGGSTEGSEVVLKDSSGASSPLSCKFTELNRSAIDDFDSSDEDLLRSASCVVLTFNSANALSFDEVTGALLTKCRAKTRHGCVYMIIACFDGITRAVSAAEAEAFASSSGLFFLEIGTKSGSNCELALTVLRIRLAASVRYFSTIAAVSATLPPASEAQSPPSAFFLSSPPRLPGTSHFVDSSVLSTPLPSLSSLISSSRGISSIANENKRAREQLSPNLSQQVTELNDLFSLIGNGAPNVNTNNTVQQQRPHQQYYENAKRDGAMSADELSVNTMQSYANNGTYSSTRLSNLSAPSSNVINPNSTTSSSGSGTSLRREKPHHSSALTESSATGLNNQTNGPVLVPPALSSSLITNTNDRSYSSVTQSSSQTRNLVNAPYQSQTQKPQPSMFSSKAQTQMPFPQSSDNRTTSASEYRTASVSAPALSSSFAQHPFPSLPSSFPTPSAPQSALLSTSGVNPFPLSHHLLPSGGAFPFPLPPLPANFQEQFASIMATHFQSLASASASVPPALPFPFPPLAAFGGSLPSFNPSTQGNSGAAALANLQHQFQNLQIQSAGLQSTSGNVRPKDVPREMSTSTISQDNSVARKNDNAPTAMLDFSSSAEDGEKENQSSASSSINTAPESRKGWRDVARAVAAIGTIGSIKKSISNRRSDSSSAADVTGSIYSGEPFGTPASTLKVEKKDAAVSTSPSVIFPNYFSEPPVNRMSDVSIADADFDEPPALTNDAKKPIDETPIMQITRPVANVQPPVASEEKQIELVEKESQSQPEVKDVASMVQQQPELQIPQTVTAQPPQNVTLSVSSPKPSRKPFVDSLLPMHLTSLSNSSVSIVVSNPTSLASVLSSSDASNLVSSPSGVISAVAQAASVRIALNVKVLLHQRCIGTISVRRGDSASFLAQRFATERGMDEDCMNALSETLSRAFQAIYDSNSFTAINATKDDDFLSTSMNSGKSLYTSNAGSFLNASGASSLLSGRGRALLDEACSPQPQSRSILRQYEEEDGNWEGDRQEEDRIISKFRVEVHPNEPPHTFVFRANDDLNRSVDVFAHETGMDDAAKEALFEKVREISMQESGNGPPVVAQSTRITIGKAGSSSMPLVQVSKRTATRIITAASAANMNSKSVSKGMSRITSDKNRATGHTAASRARNVDSSAQKGGSSSDARDKSLPYSSTPSHQKQEQIMNSARVQSQVKSIPRSVAVALIKRGRDQQAATATAAATMTTMAENNQSRRSLSQSRSDTIMHVPPPKHSAPSSSLAPSSNQTFVDLDAFSPQKSSSNVWSTVLNDSVVNHAPPSVSNASREPVAMQERARIVVRSVIAGEEGVENSSRMLTPKSPGQLDSLDSPESLRSRKSLSPLRRQTSSSGFQSKNGENATNSKQVEVVVKEGKSAKSLPQSPLAALLSVEDDEDEDGNDHGNLTDAQKKLLQATLTGAKPVSTPLVAMASSTTARPRLDIGSANKTPQTSIMTNEDLQLKLGFQLPPPPPPPPPPSTKKMQSAPSSVVSDATETKSESNIKTEIAKKVAPLVPIGANQGKAATSRDRDQEGKGSSEATSFEVTGYNGTKIGAPFFNLDVALPGGKKGRILVCKGALPERMAAEFVAVHGLSESVLPKLLGLITSSIAAQEVKEKEKAKKQ
jgi:hypothetical protein